MMDVAYINLSSTKKCSVSKEYAFFRSDSVRYVVL